MIFFLLSADKTLLELEMSRVEWEKNPFYFFSDPSSSSSSSSFFGIAVVAEGRGIEGQVQGCCCFSHIFATIACLS